MCKDSNRAVVTSVLAAAALFGATVVCSAAVEGPYFGAELGASYSQPYNIALGDASARLKTELGERFAVAVGYTLYAGPAFESAVQFETGLLHNSVKSLNFFDDLGYISSKGDLYQVPFLADIIYRFHMGPRLVPFVGVGGGGVYQRLQVDSVNGAPVDTANSETSAAVQAMAGLSYRFDDHNELGLVYKYLVVFPKTDDYAATHSLMLAYVLRF